jgi:hypothetical protein
MRALFVLGTLDTHMLGQSCAPIDPWNSDGGACNPRDIWVGEESPLRFMASLLSNWPSDTPTVDLNDEERHLRFIQIVAGYPEIGRGMYPLDWPTHPTSIKALRLSLFLDSLPVPSDYSATPFHSVRSAILYLDSKEYDYGGSPSQQVKGLHSNCLTLLFRSIRLNGGSEENDDFSELTADEAVFLNNLHSCDNDRVRRWWPTEDSWGKKINVERNRKKSFDSNNMHVFKLSKIQTWIEKWTNPHGLEGGYPLSDAVRQNILAGTSVLLESLFAQLRRYILTTYRPGSIVTDGGGRITFYAKKDKLKIEEDLKEFVQESFTSLAIYHPYNHIITQSLEKFGSGKICTKCPEIAPPKTNRQQQQDVDLEDGRPLKECSHGTRFPQWEWKETNGRWTPKKGAYQRFLKNEVFPKRFFPPISYAHYDGNPPPLDEAPLYKGCPMCDTSILIEKGPVNSPFKIPGVCFPHALTFEIGKSYKRRDFSVRKKGKYNPEGAQVHSCAAIDINALGHLFTSPLQDNVKSELHEFVGVREDIDEEELMRVLGEKENIYWLSENIDFEDIDDDALRDSLKKYSSQIRDRLVIFKSRKSFQFNAKWWISISKTLESEPQTYLGEIGAWVAAGDDLLLVRRGEKSESNETLKKLLKELDVQLQKQFPKSKPTVSFCAGIEYRKVGTLEITIFQTIQKSKNYENICKDNWKTRARENNKSEYYTSFVLGKKIEKKFTESFLWEKDSPEIKISVIVDNERDPVESSMICEANRANKSE